MTTRAIVGGTVWDPASGRRERADLLVRDGIVEAIAPSVGRADETLDAGGCWVLPGFIDLHTHLREPGDEHKETIATGTAAAAAGGFTTVVAMANTGQRIDSVPLVHYVRTRPAAVRVLPAACVTRGLGGEQLTDFAALAEAGAVAFSDDGRPSPDGQVIRRALEYARVVNRPILVHEEDPALAKGGIVNEGRVSLELGLPGIPAEAEDVITARDIALARLTGGRLHFCHVSTRRSVEMIRAAKREGLRVTAEVTPHHLIVTEEELRSFDPRFKVKPPLRTEEDAQALREGLRDGTIDAIATDHAPHAPGDKETDLARAAFGVVGLETALGACLSVLEPEVVLRALTAGPAAVLGLPLGRLAVGTSADIAVVDPEEPWTVDPARFRSKGRASAFDGRVLRGRVRATLVGGNLCF